MPKNIQLKRRVIGEVREDGFFQQHRLGSKHFLRSPRAIAFDVEVLDKAERAGAHGVEIFDDETGKSYRARIETIRKRGFKLNRGFGDQIALSLCHFNQDEKSEPHPKTSPQAQQMMLEGV